MSKIAAKWMVYVCLPSQLKTRLSSVFVAIVCIQGRIFFISKVITVILRVNGGWILELVQSVSRDINKFIEQWNFYVLVGKVRDDSECSNRVVEEWTIEFRYALPLFCEMMMSGPRYLARILQLRDFLMAVFLTKTRLLSLKSYLMMVVACSCSKWIMASTHAVYMAEARVARCNSSPSNQVGGGKRGIGKRKKTSCFSNVEGQKWVCAGGCKVQGTAHMSLGCDMVSPHDRGNYQIPLWLIPIAGLE